MLTSSERSHCAPTAVQSITEAAVGQARRFGGEDRSCFDGGVVQRCWSPAVHWQRESQSTAWHNGLPLTFLSCASSHVSSTISLSLSLLTHSLSLNLFFREDTVALPYHPTVTFCQCCPCTRTSGEGGEEGCVPASMCVCARVCVCVCVLERKREKKREREQAADCVAACVWQTIAGSVALGCTKYTGPK